MRRSVTALAVVAAALMSVAATPTQSVRSNAQDTKARASLSLMAKATPLIETELTSSQPLTCQQQCDVNYVRTHQICLAAIASLKTQYAPRTQDCDRAAKSGIQQCQATCKSGAEVRETAKSIED
ncbi:MAG: hypothetical protein AAFP97_12880 [Pseudomonadota bacterium]